MKHTMKMMRAGDLPDVIRLEEALFTTPWSLAVFEDELDRDDSISYVVRDENGSLMGYVMARVFLDEVHILNLAVRRGARRRGLGTKMAKKALSDARKLGAVGATLEVRSKNLAAIRLYERLGFVSVGKRKGYYEQPRDDAVIMWLYDIGVLMKKNP